jgi:aspartate/methionine/tyrosine aminotransferase
MTRIQGHQTSCPSAVSQVAALGALRDGEKEAEELKFSLVKKRDTLVREISKIEKVKLIPPRATFYSFADFSAYEKNSHKLAEYLIDVAKVVTIPGKDFGIDGHLRISFCGPEDELIEGIARIKEAIYKYKS